MGSDNQYEHQSEWINAATPRKTYTLTSGAFLDLAVVAEQMSGIDKLMEAYENVSKQTKNK